MVPLLQVSLCSFLFFVIFPLFVDFIKKFLGLNGGQIAGIVIGVVAAAAVLIILAVVLSRCRRTFPSYYFDAESEIGEVREMRF